jgi:hypothetical protein
MPTSPDNPTADAVEQMAERLSGFRTLAGFRKYAYQAAVVAAFIAGAVVTSQQGVKQGFTTAGLTALFGIAGIRLLTAPIGAFLWYRHWRCPACGKRLGTQVILKCPHCSARLFPDPDEGKTE